jgi:Winged helix DNA-binding domain
VGRLVGVQAQDWRSARLALRARSDGLTPTALDAAAADGSLVVAWLLRGTLHLVRAEDHGWLLGLTARAGLVESRRRLAEEGVTEPQVDTALRVIAAGPADGARSRQELIEHLAAAGVPVAGQAVHHCLRLAALHGRAVLVPGAAGSLFIRAIDPPAAPNDRDAAVVELARRYLRGHGPATAADLAVWSGLPLRDARAGLRGLGAVLVECADGLVDLARRDAAVDDLPGVPPRLLPPFDPFLLGWADRSFAVPEHLRSRVQPGGGMLRATATVDGAAVGTWTLRRRGGRPEIALDVAEPAHVEALQSDVADVLRFSG